MTKKYHRRFVDPRDQYRRWIDPRLSGIHLGDAIAYLKRNGWVEVSSDRNGFRVFQEPQVDEAVPLYQFLPDAEGGDDYALRMFEFITGVAEFEDRPASAIIDDMLRDHPKTTNGSIQEQSVKEFAGS